MTRSLDFPITSFHFTKNYGLDQLPSAIGIHNTTADNLRVAIFTKPLSDPDLKSVDWIELEAGKVADHEMELEEGLSFGFIGVTFRDWQELDGLDEFLYQASATIRYGQRATISGDHVNGYMVHIE